MAVKVNADDIHVMNDQMFRHEPMFAIEAEDGAMFNLDLRNKHTQIRLLIN